MTESDDDRLAALDAVLWRDDPRSARGPRRGRARKHPGHRRARAWLALSLAVGAVVTGILAPHGLLMATGLVAAALAVHVLDTAPRHHGRRRRGS
ncbi:DUF3040 domain-containing protein [Streptomyces sp. NPDC127584]|uniref:DUF3040 domain-containing protein n=1 Tax=Streptomyces sp. NPDC127584 TaxID=3345403 RepID=UPI003627ED18